MIGQALVVTVAVTMVVLFVLMDRLSYLAAYKMDLYANYSTALAFSAVVFGMNVFAAVYLLNRKFFLRDAGLKLRHLSKEIHGTESPLEEIREKFSER